MSRPRLRLVSNSNLIESEIPMHTSSDTAQLWELVKDKSVHCILQEPAIMELARRNTPGIFDCCEDLLDSDQHDNWLIGIKALAVIGTNEALNRLIVLFAHSIENDRRLILDLIAKKLTANHVKPFSIIVRDVAAPGVLDVTGWTSVAIATLIEVCSRFGVEVVSDLQILNKSKVNSQVQEECTREERRKSGSKIMNR